MLPHVAASRIVRQVYGLAHLSPGEWLRCLPASDAALCKFSFKPHKTRRSFFPTEAGLGQGAEAGAEAGAFEDHTKC